MAWWRWLAVVSTVCLVISSPIKLKVKVPWKLHINVHHVTECNQPSIMNCSEMTYRHNKGGDLLVSSDCSVIRDIKELTEAMFMLTRCREAVSYNTCEYYQTFRWNVGICEMLHSSAMPWPNIWNRWKPPISCPTRAGNYSLIDAKVALPEVALIEWAGYVWIGNASMRAERGALFTCKTFQFEATRVRA